MQVNAKLFHPSGIVALATNSGSPSPRKSIQKRSGGGILSQKRSRAGYTYPSQAAAKRIDYVFLARGRGLMPLRSWIPATEASDHRPIVLELRLK